MNDALAHPDFIAFPHYGPPGCTCAWTWYTITNGPENIYGMRRNGPRADCPVSLAAAAAGPGTDGGQ